MFKGNQVNFAGQTIFVGLDVHKTNWKVCVVYNGEKAASFAQDPDGKQLIKTLKDKFPGIEKINLVYEAGFSGFGAYRLFKELNVDCIVVNAADIPTSDKDRKTKTDKRDARKLAFECSKGTLQGIYVPDEKIEAIRALVRYRKSMVNDRTATINRLKHYLMCYSLPVEEKLAELTKQVVCRLREIELTVQSKEFTLGHLLDEYEHRSTVIVQITNKLEGLIRQNEELREIHDLLRSVDGVGLITALTLQTELIDMKRFKNKDLLCSYVGLVPDIYSSNDKYSRLGMTNRANKHIKPILIEASWSAIKKDPALKELYYRYKDKMPANKAIIRIAKHLLLRIRAVWVNKEVYQRGMLSPLKEPAIAA